MLYFFDVFLRLREFNQIRKEEEHTDNLLLANRFLCNAIDKHIVDDFPMPVNFILILSL